LARKVATLTRKVNKMPAPELKYFDSERTASASVGYNLDVVKDALVVPAVGDTSITRDGAQITLNKLHIRMRVLANALQAEPSILRVVLLQAKERYVPSNTAVIGTVTNLFESANTNDAVHSMFGWTNRIHYRILKDFKVAIQSTGTSGGAALSEKVLKISYKFKQFNKAMRFDASTTTAQKNQVYLCVISTSGVNYPTIEYAARTTFYDN